MIPKTQDQLRALVRFYTDTLQDLNKFPDADIDAQLDIGLQCYHAALCRSMTWIYPESYEFTTTANGSPPSGTNPNIYSVPLHYRTIAVERKGGNNRWYPQHRANLFTSSREEGTSVGRPFPKARYHEFIHGETQYIQLYRPESTAGVTYRIRYIAPSRTITGEPTPDLNYLFPNGWEEVPVLEAAIRLLAVDKENDEQLYKLLDRAYKRMELESSSSDIFQRPTVPGVHEITIDDEEQRG